VSGTVTVDWIKRPTSFDLKVAIPAGMEADIDIPKLGLTALHITEGGKTVWKSNTYVPGTPGITRAKAGSDSIVFHAGSGSYHFTLNGAVVRSPLIQPTSQATRDDPQQQSPASPDRRPSDRGFRYSAMFEAINKGSVNDD
jgi:hypothetical protein